MNDLIHLIHTRRSIGNLSLPMPSHDELNSALACAMSAPDHKVLRPYRFSVMTGKTLDDFGQVLLKAWVTKRYGEQVICVTRLPSKIILVSVMIILSVDLFMLGQAMLSCPSVKR